MKKEDTDKVLSKKDSRVEELVEIHKDRFMMKVLHDPTAAY